ncbi:hypothetical protein [Mycobacterium sp. DBP42]|uniref:hypothetical protein n=1 Tax=Mycobacterium sp. DBP42 TaxID=2545267 RepID=UPI00110D1BFC|nr:hypothetical protein [Mycobacterium sp. DBP42]TMS50671.1 hypothetical protein E0T84_22535 [Mycobacterium sp. DBP42]
MTAKASVSLDRHVVILNAAGTFTPNGFRLTGPVTSVDKLETLITYVVGKTLLRPLPASSGVDPAPSRLWFVGDGGRLLVGATDEASAEDVAAQVGPTLAPLISRGWELKGAPEGRFVLTGSVAHPEDGPQHVSVEVVVEARPWIGGGAIIDDHVELGRRLTAWHAALGVLPASSAHGSGAVLLDTIRATRIARPAKSDRSGDKKPPAVLTENGELISGVNAELRIQPAWAGTPTVVQQQQLDHAVDLALLEQKYPHLASAGMISLGYGRPQRLRGHQAADAAAAAKRPFGMWRALLPAAEKIDQPAWLPAPHPQIRAGEATRTWVSTEDLDNLAKDVKYGGANLSMDSLDIDAAVVWQHQGRLLETWTERLRDDALVAFAGQPALCALVEEVAREYTTAMGDPNVWDHEEWRHHYQPAIAAAIAAHIRFRFRRVAMRLSREYRAIPLYVHGFSSVYALGIDADTEQPVDLSDKHTQLGRVEITRRIALADETVLALVLAETPEQIANVLTTSLDVPAAHDELALVPVATDPSDECTDTGPQDKAQTGAAGGPAEHADKPGHAEPGAAAAASQPVAPVSSKAGRSSTRAKSKPATVKGGAPAAAVLHTDGLWLPDGTCITPAKLGELTHVGHVAKLADTYNIGYPLSEDYAEPGQIWVTEAACRQFGIDVAELAEARARDRVSLLHEMTENIPFVTAAVADGWRLGGDKNVARLGAWTRVYRDDSDKTAVQVVLIAGLDTALTAEESIDDEDTEDDVDTSIGMPILAGRPTPAQVAHRLQLLADALGFPYKISDGVTALDLLDQARPRPSKDGKGWNVKDWKGIVLAPSTTELPYGIGDVERDFNVWCRIPTAEEMRALYVHAYDRGGSYFAGLGSLQLPIGDAVHYSGGTKFDPNLPGFWLVEVPENDNRFMPHLLNPGGYQFTEPRWVSTSRIEMAFKLGYELDIQGALVWPRHGRIFRLWCDRFSHASVTLDIDDPDAQAVRNQTKIIRVRGFGIMKATYMKDRQGYHPARWYLGIGKASATIAYRINDIGQKTGRWPVAADHDTLIYVSNDPNPETAWPGGPATWGRSFGKYKHEGSSLLADHLEFLDGNTYRGKKHLTSPGQWRELLPTLSKGDQ